MPQKLTPEEVASVLADVPERHRERWRSFLEHLSAAQLRAVRRGEGLGAAGLAPTPARCQALKLYREELGVRIGKLKASVDGGSSSVPPQVYRPLVELLETHLAVEEELAGVAPPGTVDVPGFEEPAAQRKRGPVPVGRSTSTGRDVLRENEGKKWLYIQDARAVFHERSRADAGRKKVEDHRNAGRVRWMRRGPTEYRYWADDFRRLLGMAEQHDPAGEELFIGDPNGDFREWSPDDEDDTEELTADDVKASLDAGLQKKREQRKAAAARKKAKKGGAK